MAFDLPHFKTNDTVNGLFFNPLHDLFAVVSHRRHCPKLDDLSWLLMGIWRVLDESGSGRGFLQEHGLRFQSIPTVRNYFQSLRSERRADLVTELNDLLLESSRDQLTDRLADIPELNTYEVFAVDGHWHTGATHDPKADEKKVSTGHFYSLDLRRHTLRDLAVNEYPKEHDMHVLKRLKPRGLRQGVVQGKRVLTVYDRAGVDFDYWRRCQKECAVYFLSRVKENMVFDSLFELKFDKEDPRNAGVQRDERVHSKKNLNFRVITYLEPETGQSLEFLTNVMDMEPGILVELYRRRWEIEKVFDDLKNKLGQKKSWSSDLTGKRSQGQLIALTYNLVRLLEDLLQEEHGIRNEAEEERKIRQRQKLAIKVRESGRQISSLLENACKATQRSVKYIRWLRGCLRDRVAASVALPFLRSLYEEL